MLTVKAADVAAFQLASAAWVAVITQVPDAAVTWRLPLTIEQAVDEPALKVIAPVPDAPEVEIV
jgi:hypothetical protein